MKILVINAGSSSIKFQLLNYNDLTVITKGLCEAIGVDGNFKITYNNETKSIKEPFPNQEKALSFLMDYLLNNKIIDSIDDIVGIGHRIVHGGSKMTSACIVNDPEIKIIDSYTPLAPLHIPPELTAIKVLKKLFKNAKQVTVFDTSFHQTIPYENYMYAVQNEWCEKYEVRKYGFHGISYQFITKKMETILNKDKVNLIICHLGNGASICAVKNSQSINTSMGFSPLDGLIMGTRTGDISPTVVAYMAKQLNKSYDEIIDICTKASGMKGLTGYADMRDVEENLKQSHVKKGFDLYIKRIASYISTYANDLQNKIDAIVFCGGVGENSDVVRCAVASQLFTINAQIDEKINTQRIDSSIGYLKISTNNSLPIYAVNTNEELMIAQEVKRLVK